jgi:hypothetical protein
VSEEEETPNVSEEEESPAGVEEAEEPLPTSPLSHPMNPPPTVTPGSKVRLNAHSTCAQESSLHTYRIENGYKITLSQYNIFITE